MKPSLQSSFGAKCHMWILGPDNLGCLKWRIVSSHVMSHVCSFFGCREEGWQLQWVRPRHRVGVGYVTRRPWCKNGIQYSVLCRWTLAIMALNVLLRFWRQVCSIQHLNTKWTHLLTRCWLLPCSCASIPLTIALQCPPNKRRSNR